MIVTCHCNPLLLKHCSQVPLSDQLISLQGEMNVFKDISTTVLKVRKVFS